MPACWPSLSTSASGCHCQHGLVEYMIQRFFHGSRQCAVPGTLACKLGQLGVSVPYCCLPGLYCRFCSYVPRNCSSWSTSKLPRTVPKRTTRFAAVCRTMMVSLMHASRERST
eukprot:450705-Amphidinium_carterae.3